MGTYSAFRDHMLRFLEERPAPTHQDLQRLLRDLAKFRHELIANTLRQRQGDEVRAGPFAGMRYGVRSAEGCTVPRLLGCYEQELAPHLERLIARGFRHVVNVGCAEGYYAVGMARRLPDARVAAFDSDATARERCRSLAAANGVEGRLEVGGTFVNADFARYPAGETLVLLDIEGHEDALLDPPATLRCLTVLVECHDCFSPGLSTRLATRFADSHAITRIANRPVMPDLPDWLAGMSQLDQHLACWEWRSGPTPWLLLEPLSARQP